MWKKEKNEETKGMQKKKKKKENTGPKPKNGPPSRC